MKSSLEILYEDNHVLVINKPAGIATLGSSAGEPSLVTLGKQYLKQKYQKPGNVYLGVVSRLDSPTTGVVVLARTSKAAARLSAEFKRRAVSKYYLALVENELQTPTGELVHGMRRDPATGSVQVRSDPPQPADDGPRSLSRGKTGKHRDSTGGGSHRIRPRDQIWRPAILQYRTLSMGRGPALLLVRLGTGRRHQIRAQLAAAGSPILGDKRYGARNTVPSGIALHSYQISFTHPTRRERLSLAALPPRWWNLEIPQSRQNLEELIATHLREWEIGD